MTDNDGEEKLASLGMPLHIAKQQLRDDPETQKIADALGVDIEDYIEQVIHYAQRPQLDAQVKVVPDEEFEEAGISVPSVGDVNAWFEGVANGEISVEGPGVTPETETYTEEKEEGEVLREAAGVEVERAAPTREQLKGEVKVTDNAAGSVLKNQLRAQQQRTLQRREARQAASAQSKSKPKKPPKKTK